MAVIAAPEVLPPLTPFSKRVRVRGTFDGAEVSIVVNGAKRGRAIADGAVTVVPLDPGFSLQAGASVSATQRIGNETSDFWPEPVIVLKAPTSADDVGSPFSRAPIVECTTALWLEGVLPGATVTAVVPGQVLQVDADDVGVHVTLPYPLGPGGTVDVSQEIGGIAGPTRTLDALRLDRQTWPAPPPTVGQPLARCQHVIELSGIRPGATVVLVRDGVEDFAEFGATRGVFRYARGLERDERVRVRQDMPAPECRLTGTQGEVLVTEDRPPPPSLPYAVCERDVVVSAAGLKPGATVELRSDGTVITRARAAQSVARINVPPGALLGATALSVVQSLCEAGPWSEEGRRRVDPFGQVAGPQILEPIVECGRAVAVSGVDDGTQVRIVSEYRGGEIGFAIANGDHHVDVDLLPFALQAGDRIRVRTIRCGLSRDWPPVQVIPLLVDVGPPGLTEPVDDPGGSVLVTGVVPGAVVTVEQVPARDTPHDVVGAVVGTAVGSRPEVPVPIPHQPPGTLLRARQQVCQRISAPSGAALVGLRSPAYRSNSTFRICQLTGPSDPTGRPHPFDTETVDLYGTDLGISVEQGGRLWFFFGDCYEGHVSDPDGDPIAWSTTEDLGPRADRVPELTWIVNEEGAFQRLVVGGLPPLGNFEVPSGAFTFDGSLYLFIARHEIDNKMRLSHLARSVGGIAANGPTLLYDVSSTGPPVSDDVNRWLIHVSPSVVSNADWPGLPQSTGHSVLAFGTSVYQESNMYLAWFPITPGQDPPHPSEWLLLSRLDPSGKPEWRTQEQLNLMPGPTPDRHATPMELLSGGQPLAELSVAYVPALQRWVLTYSHGHCRVAPMPWGPWSDEIVIFDGQDPTRNSGNLKAGGRFIGARDAEDESRPSTTYAPYIVNRWSRWDPSTRQLRLTYVLSTSHAADMRGYQPQLMRSTIEWNES